MRIEHHMDPTHPFDKLADEGRMTVKRKAFHPLTPAQAGASCSST